MTLAVADVDVEAPIEESAEELEGEEIAEEEPVEDLPEEPVEAFEESAKGGEEAASDAVAGWK